MKPEIKRRFERLVERLEFSELADGRFSDKDGKRKCDLHPTMKPVGLVANAMLDGTKEGDVVLDIFGGSGTTLIAAEQLQRKAYLMELDAHYCDVIIARLEKETGLTAIKIN